MHSIVMPSSPAFSTISSFIANPTPCCPFLPLTPLQSPLKKAAVSRCHSFENSVPFCLLQSNDITILSSTGSQQGIDVPIPLTPLTAAMRTLNVPNVSSSSQDFALAALCFLWADFLSTRFPRSFFRANILRLHSVPGIFHPGYCLRSPDVLGTALPPRLDFSITDTFVYSRVPSEHSSSPRFRSHVFRGGGVPTLLPQARLPRETISLCWGASPPVDAIILAGFCTVSINQFSHQSMK